MRKLVALLPVVLIALGVSVARPLAAQTAADSAAIRAACADVQHDLAELVVAHLRRQGVLTSRASAKR